MKGKVVYQFKNCEFCLNQIGFLGYVVINNGIEVDLTKVKALSGIVQIMQVTLVIF